MPHTTRIFDGARGTGVPLDPFRRRHDARSSRDIAEAGGDVIGVDWRQPLDEAWAVIGHDRGDPGQSRSDAAARPARSAVRGGRRCPAARGGRPGHIFNLGHGVLPTTPLETRAGARAPRARVPASRDPTADRSRSLAPSHACDGCCSSSARGITGSAAAFELPRAAFRFPLARASPRAGGLIRTEHVDGFTIEAGPDSVLAQKPAALELCEELGLGPQLITTHAAAHRVRAASAARLHPLPSPSVLGIPTDAGGACATTICCRSPARARLALEPLVPRAAIGGDESVGVVLPPPLRRGDRRSHRASRCSAASTPGDIEQLSMRSLFPRFVEAEARRGSVLRAFRRAPARAERRRRPVPSLSSAAWASSWRHSSARLPAGSIRYGTAAAMSAALDAERNDAGDVRRADGSARPQP